MRPLLTRTLLCAFLGSGYADAGLIPRQFDLGTCGLYTGSVS